VQGGEKGQKRYWRVPKWGAGRQKRLKVMPWSDGEVAWRVNDERNVNIYES